MNLHGLIPRAEARVPRSDDTVSPDDFVTEEGIHGRYKSMGLTPFLCARFAKGERVVERDVI
ncbi:MAG: hypothetical protein C0524_01280 [Rhodobacter sp.]|nr:hypothetical protein [Rhodobacter sp.]